MLFLRQPCLPFLQFSWSCRFNVLLKDISWSDVQCSKCSLHQTSLKIHCETFFPPISFKMYSRGVQNYDIFVSKGNAVVTHLASNYLINSIWCIWWYLLHGFTVQVPTAARLLKCKSTLISLICLLWVAFAMYNSSSNSLWISAYKWTLIL